MQERNAIDRLEEFVHTVCNSTLMHARVYWLSTRLLKRSQSIRISHVILRTRRNANRTCTQSQTVLHSYSVQLLYNYFPLSPKWWRDREKATRKPLRGTRNNTKATHYSKNSKEGMKKNMPKGFKKGQGAKMIPPTCTSILILLCMWRGFKKAANS